MLSAIELDPRFFFSSRKTQVEACEMEKNLQVIEETLTVLPSPSNPPAIVTTVPLPPPLPASDCPSPISSPPSSASSTSRNPLGTFCLLLFFQAWVPSSREESARRVEARMGDVEFVNVTVVEDVVVPVVVAMLDHMLTLANV
jgi:hypothetical protein